MRGNRDGAAYFKDANNPNNSFSAVIAETSRRKLENRWSEKVTESLVDRVSGLRNPACAK
jgi:hypothetical protein